jgi:orotidine 5'-phosphate decarboxylase subfamily 2
MADSLSSSSSSSTSSSFFTKLEARVSQVDSLLCVGLDPHGAQILGDAYASSTSEQKCEAAFTFCKTIIDATLPYAACYKPNAAFFEALGVDDGNATLVRVLKEIPPEVPVLLDVKRGDIGTTAAAYAEACYDHCNADAVTLSPLMGWDSVAPFVTGKLLLSLFGCILFAITFGGMSIRTTETFVSKEK